MTDVEPLIRTQLEGLMPLPGDSRRDWADVLERYGRRQTFPRRRVLLAVAIALAAALLATPAFGLRDQIAHLFAADKRPPGLIVKYFRSQNSGPPGTAPVVAPEARVALVASIAGYGNRVVWVAPTRAGGFCSNDGCDRNRAVPFRTTLTITGPSPRKSPDPWSRDVHVLLEGDTLLRRGSTVVLHFEDGSSESTPLVWVKKPIAAGFFVYDLPKEHWEPGDRLVALVVEDANGQELARSTTASREFRDAQSKGLAPSSKAERPASAGCYGKVDSTKTFSDPAGDQSFSADIRSIKVIEYCEGAVGIELSLFGPPELTTDGPLIALDLDQNPDTGSAFDGTEVEFVYGPDTDGGPVFYRANGWDFRRARRVPGCCSTGDGTHTLFLGFSRKALGLTPNAGFNIVVSSVANHPDTAPDFGTYNYQRVQGTPSPSLGPDRRAPKVLAFDSTASRGGEAKLNYWVLEGRGRARQVVRILRGRRVLGTILTPLAQVDPFGLSQTTWRVPPGVHGVLHYSVRSIDAAGNRSKLVSAALEVR